MFRHAIIDLLWTSWALLGHGRSIMAQLHKKIRFLNTADKTIELLSHIPQWDWGMWDFFGLYGKRYCNWALGFDFESQANSSKEFAWHQKFCIFLGRSFLTSRIDVVMWSKTRWVGPRGQLISYLVNFLAPSLFVFLEHWNSKCSISASVHNHFYGVSKKS